ncbi:MAG TPA: GAF domain-containing protein [Polyangiaceae bacterium]
MPSPDDSRDGGASDRWFVANGIVALGPVSFELVLRGVAYGRIPAGSFVRHESWQVWRRLEDIEGQSAGNRRQIVAELGQHSAAIEKPPLDDASQPAAAKASAELRSRTDNVARAPRQSFRPAAVDPVGVLADASELSEALLLTVVTAVTAAAADFGLVHRARDGVATITVGGHGPGTEHLLGERLATDDPTLIAARGGHSVLTEPQCGEVGRHLLGRMTRCSSEVKSVAMVPLLVYGELIAVFEVGRKSRPFRAREIGRVEDVVEALAERSVVMGWVG